MKTLRYELSVEAKGQLLHQLRTAVFYQVELWNNAISINETLNDCQEDYWGVVCRLQQVRTDFGERIADDHDVERFAAGLDQPFRAVLDEKRKAALRQKLQKTLWIQNELWKSAA
jgi:hypothetical protein